MYQIALVNNYGHKEYVHRIYKGLPISYGNVQDKPMLFSELDAMAWQKKFSRKKIMAGLYMNVIIENAG